MSIALAGLNPASHARDLVDFDLWVEAIRAAPNPMDLDAVIGVRGPIAPPEMCNGLMVPIVIFDQIHSFDRHALIKSDSKAGADFCQKRLCRQRRRSFRSWSPSCHRTMTVELKMMEG
jgi:hypothetical protein